MRLRNGLRARNLRDRIAVNVREPHVATVEKVGEAGVVHAQQVEDRSVQVVDGYGLLLGLIAELIAGADHLAAPDARSGHPNSHRAGIVVAPNTPLRNWHAP